MKQQSNSYIISVGTLWVNMPVFAIMFGGWSVPLVIVHFLQNGAYLSPFLAMFLVVLWIVVPFSLAWLWWSLNIPRWRIWALQRTNDWSALEESAIAAGLIWSENSVLGRLFSRTEIWSGQNRQLEAKLKSKHSRFRLQSPIRIYRHGTREFSMLPTQYGSRSSVSPLGERCSCHQIQSPIDTAKRSQSLTR